MPFSQNAKLDDHLQYSHLKVKSGKCNLLLSSKTPTDVSIGDASLKNLKLAQKKPSISVSSICSKASKKLHALGRIVICMSFNKRRILMKTFIESQFNYWPQIWMFQSRIMNSKTNRIHEGALRLIYSDQLLKKDQSFFIHHKNIPSLAIERTIFFTVFLQVS